MSNLLEKINSPQDLKKLNLAQLSAYSKEVRRFIFDSVSNTGGHLASNLGVVELTIALHYVFNSPHDKILWDVGHQSYTHKIITGRRDKFDKLRICGGISGFPKPSESEHDAFTMGHSSTSLSLALGMARARDIKQEKFDIIGFIGDGALTGGMAFEAINDIGATKAKMIIILNDNKMSISQNVGAFSNYLAKLRLSKGYFRLKHNIKNGVKALPFFGDKIYHALNKTKDSVKSALQANKIFESLGIKYYGPFDGHNISNLINVLKQAKEETTPIILHMVTEKGRGYAAAESNPCKFHGISGEGKHDEKSFSEISGNFLCEAAASNNDIVAISAAMLDGTGLTQFNSKFKNRCFDVGIAEQHATTLAAGLAAGGCKPYFAVYSSFLQRAYDQVVHDICINNLPVTFLVDRAGAVGADGVTHQGLFDISYLNSVPNITIAAPADGIELKKLLIFSEKFNSPLAIRYPKGYKNTYCLQDNNDILLGKWVTLRQSKKKIYILAVGNRMLDLAFETTDSNIINARFVKPLDTQLLDKINSKNALIITLEDNAIKGGFGESVLSYLNQTNLIAKVVNLGFNDTFECAYSIEKSMVNAGLTAENINKVIKNFANSWA